MSFLAAASAPPINWSGFSPILALFVGAILALLVGLLRSRGARFEAVPAITAVAFAASAGLAVWQWGEEGGLFANALTNDHLSQLAIIAIAFSGVAATLLSIGANAPKEASHGEYHALLLVSAAGMAILASSDDMIATFVGVELLSVPLYVLAATELKRRRSLEAGMKYLIIGSIGSATLLYGLALIFGATGQTNYTEIAAKLAANDKLLSDGLLVGGVAMVVVGLAFKASIAPFHTWAPDVYEGSPTPVTSFMATATKVAVFVAMLRFFDGAVDAASDIWQPILAVLAAVSIIVGNLGALGQSSLKRLLAFSSVAQAGYILVGVVAAASATGATGVGVRSVVFYLLAYVVLSAAAFAVVVAAENRYGTDHQDSIVGLGHRLPLHGVALSASLLGLAGIPATVGFVAKLRILQGAVDAGYTWLAVILVVGSMISLGYYLRILALVWKPAGEEIVASAEADRPETAAISTTAATTVALVAGILIIGLGVFPGPLMDQVEQAIGFVTNAQALVIK